MFQYSNCVQLRSINTYDTVLYSFCWDLEITALNIKHGCVVDILFVRMVIKRTRVHVIPRIRFTTKIKKWTLHETRFVTQVCILWRNWAVWQVFNCLSKSWAPKFTNPRKPDGHWPNSNTGKLMTKGNKTLKRLLYSLKATCWDFISKHENLIWHTGNLLIHDVIKQEYIYIYIYNLYKSGKGHSLTTHSLTDLNYKVLPDA